MHYYRYLHDGRIIESDEPRPDLLEWAYWSEVDAPAKAKLEPVEPEGPVEAPAVEPEPEAKPAAKKAAPRKAPAKKAD